MSDIVERLRSKDIEVMLLEGGPELTLTLSTWHEAADEIERLREALRHYVSECDCNGGTFIWHDDITGKDLVRDCPKCEPARAALGEEAS